MTKLENPGLHLWVQTEKQPSHTLTEGCIGTCHWQKDRDDLPDFKYLLSARSISSFLCYREAGHGSLNSTGSEAVSDKVTGLGSQISSGKPRSV